MKDFIRGVFTFIGFMLGILVFLGIILGILSVPVYFLEVAACDAKWTDRPSEFSFFGGCLAEHEGVMVPSDSIRFEGETR